MQALVFTAQGQPLAYQTDYPEPTAGPGEVVVDVKAAALNHRDVYITQGLYPRIVTPIILGSDGAGTVDGRAVIINPNIGWGEQERFPDRRYTILGMPSPGTFAERVVVARDRLVDKPPHLSFEQAAALPLCGLTAFRAVFTKGELATGQRVLITGSGGGVALSALQFALAAGARVWVTSGSNDKLAKAQALGAEGGANYRTEDWDQTLVQQARDFDLIIDGAGGAGFQRLVKLAAPGGRIVVYGGTQGAVPKFSPQHIFWRQLTILGTSMGSDREFQDMVDFVNTHQITPVVDKVFALEEGQQAFQRMDEGEQFGKIILQTV